VGKMSAEIKTEDIVGKIKTEAGDDFQFVITRLGDDKYALVRRGKKKNKSCFIQLRNDTSCYFYEEEDGKKHMKLAFKKTGEKRRAVWVTCSSSYPYPNNQVKRMRNLEDDLPQGQAWFASSNPAMSGAEGMFHRFPVKGGFRYAWDYPDLPWPLGETPFDNIYVDKSLPKPIVYAILSIYHSPIILGRAERPKFSLPKEKKSAREVIPLSAIKITKTSNQVQENVRLIKMFADIGIQRKEYIGVENIVSPEGREKYREVVHEVSDYCSSHHQCKMAVKAKETGTRKRDKLKRFVKTFTEEEDLDEKAKQERDCFRDFLEKALYWVTGGKSPYWCEMPLERTVKFLKKPLPEDDVTKVNTSKLVDVQKALNALEQGLCIALDKVWYDSKGEKVPLPAKLFDPDMMGTLLAYLRTTEDEVKDPRLSEDFRNQIKSIVENMRDKEDVAEVVDEYLRKRDYDISHFVLQFMNADDVFMKHASKIAEQEEMLEKLGFDPEIYFKDH